ncbi:hypothetical protein RGU70_14280 [Herbaspirillum sp. RTI4]|uniref:hypothetical protein n=1 Tax=Herbaspirillum sp. RTI4 TaxID=3048640 RepID=UPI002AB4497A|nr:hypothetical protein [Herbaspirillum sp. RTI4]MDY7579482.1 hypothetical protein [Herbaspirillum sp. RTI4]MEA9980396.1 hypothetical protein [Herbaspirillum sp. RTI4]
MQTSSSPTLFRHAPKRMYTEDAYNKTKGSPELTRLIYRVGNTADLASPSFRRSTVTPQAASHRRRPLFSTWFRNVAALVRASGRRVIDSATAVASDRTSSASAPPPLGQSALKIRRNDPAWIFVPAKKTHLTKRPPLPAFSVVTVATQTEPAKLMVSVGTSPHMPYVSTPELRAMRGLCSKCHTALYAVPISISLTSLDSQKKSDVQSARTSLMDLRMARPIPLEQPPLPQPYVFRSASSANRLSSHAEQSLDIHPRRITRQLTLPGKTGRSSPY